MRLRPYIVLTLVRKDMARLVRNGPALMLLGLLVVMAFLLGFSGLIEEEQEQDRANTQRNESWIVYWEDSDWIELLKRRAPKELGIRFAKANQLASKTYPPHICVIEIRKTAFFRDRNQTRRQIHYRYPGSDQKVLWPITRWFLSVSLEHFGKMPQFFETIQPVVPPTQQTATRNSLENVSVADALSLSLIGSTLLTTILFFAASGLLVSMTAQERERGALRAILLSPASYFEFVASKAVVHGGLALGTSAIVVAALKPEVLTSLLFWGTMIAQTCGYFAVGLLIASFAKNQAAPNLLSFAYILAIGSLNLLAYRFDAFRFISVLTFERYGLMFTIASFNDGELSIGRSLGAMSTPDFLMLVLLTSSLLLIATCVGSLRLRTR